MRGRTSEIKQAGGLQPGDCQPNAAQCDLSGARMPNRERERRICARPPRISPDYRPIELLSLPALGNSMTMTAHQIAGGAAPITHNVTGDAQLTQYTASGGLGQHVWPSPIPSYILGWRIACWWLKLRLAGPTGSQSPPARLEICACEPAAHLTRWRSGPPSHHTCALAWWGFGACRGTPAPRFAAQRGPSCAAARSRYAPNRQSPASAQIAASR